MGKNPRRKYSKDFRMEAVKLVTEQGYSISEAALNLGINANMLGRWKTLMVNRGDTAFPVNGKIDGVEEELRRLREKNHRLKMEREILKKAAAIFARETEGNTHSFGSMRRHARYDSCVGCWKFPVAATAIENDVVKAEGNGKVRNYLWPSKPSQKRAGILLVARGFTRP